MRLTDTHFVDVVEINNFPWMFTLKIVPITSSDIFI